MVDGSKNTLELYGLSSLELDLISMLASALQTALQFM